MHRIKVGLIVFLGISCCFINTRCDSVITIETRPSLIGDEGIKDYFRQEMTLTLQDILSHTLSPAVVMPILTDSHLGIGERAKEQLDETLSNINCLCNNIDTDGVIHLGDLLMISWYEELSRVGYTKETNDSITRHMMKDFLLRYRLIHPKNHLYAIGGNHDGEGLKTYKSDKWNDIVGRFEDMDNTIIKPGSAPYFYVDFEKCGLRCVFLQQPNDYKNNGKTTYGYTEDLLKWLSDDAFNVVDGMNIVLFSHIPPFFASYLPNGELPNRRQFYDICNAFHHHTVCNNEIVSSDYTNFKNSKILCLVSGHAHGDAIYMAGESYTGTAVINGSSVPWTFKNDMPCPVVIITNTYCGGNGDGVTRNGYCGTYHVPRMDGTVTQEAWDTFVYNPREEKIFFIRFGSGMDRVVDLTSVL